MKRSVIILLSVFAAVVLILALYIYYIGETYPERAIERYTHIANYQVISQIHNNYELFSDILIDEKDGNDLLKLHSFTLGDSSIDWRGGTDSENLIQKKANYWYYFEKDGHGIYGYLCLCLSNDKKHLQILEVYGD